MFGCFDADYNGAFVPLYCLNRNEVFERRFGRAKSAKEAKQVRAIVADQTPCNGKPHKAAYGQFGFASLRASRALRLPFCIIPAETWFAPGVS